MQHDYSHEHAHLLAKERQAAILTVILKCSDLLMSAMCPQYQGQRCCSWHVMDLVMRGGGTGCDCLAANFYFHFCIEFKIIRLWKYCSGSRTVW